MSRPATGPASAIPTTVSGAPTISTLRRCRTINQAHRPTAGVRSGSPGGRNCVVTVIDPTVRIEGAHGYGSMTRLRGSARSHSVQPSLGTLDPGLESGTERQWTRGRDSGGEVTAAAGTVAKRDSMTAGHSVLPEAWRFRGSFFEDAR